MANFRIVLVVALVLVLDSILSFGCFEDDDDPKRPEPGTLKFEI